MNSKHSIHPIFFKAFKSHLLVLVICAVSISKTFGQSVVYNAGNGTFKVPDKVTSIKVEAWGGGASGGVHNDANNDDSRGGGGGGGYATNNFSGSNLGGLSIVWSVGSGGLITPATREPGANGQSSTYNFNSTGIVTAFGGSSNKDNGGDGGKFSGITGTTGRDGGKGANRVDKDTHGGGGGGSGPGTGSLNASGQTGGSQGGGNGGSTQSNGVNGVGPGGGGGGRGAKSTSRVSGNGANGRIQISWGCSTTLTSGVGSNNQTICGTNITPITYEISGAYGATVSGLPSGVTATYSNGDLRISGTPTVAGTFTYTVRPTGYCENSTATGTITVNLSGPSLTPLTCVNAAIPTIRHEGTGITSIGAISWSPSNPGGISVSLSGNTISISGTPTTTSLGVYSYTIPVSGNCGPAEAKGSFSIIGLAPSASASTFSQNVCLNQALIPITHSVSRVSSMGTPSNLPLGVTASISGSTLTISGTPTVAGTYNYSIPLTNCVGTTNATGTIVVNGNCSVSNCSTTIEDANNVIIQFTGNCDWVVPAGIDDFEVLVIGAGGGGGAQSGGGGGAGGLVHLKATMDRVNNPGVKVGDIFSIKVGAKGVGSSDKDIRGGQGGSSELKYKGLTIQAGGGGAGGSDGDSDGQGGDGVDNVIQTQGSLPGGISLDPNLDFGGSGGGVSHSVDVTKKGKGKKKGGGGGKGRDHTGGAGGSLTIVVENGVEKYLGIDGEEPIDIRVGNETKVVGGSAGAGITIPKFGSISYAAGGGGGSQVDTPPNFRITAKGGGSGGFGNGASASSGADGITPGSGGGGSGHSDGTVSGGDGASGAVIISYPKLRILPIEFIHFSASFDAEGREGDLSWATAKEWGNSHFEVQRSVNDVQNWKTIGQVDGAGYSNNRNDYAYIDKALPAAGGNVFYRLKQLDFEGNSSFSVTRAIRVEAVAGASSWIIYPNPTSGENFRIELANSETPDEGGFNAVLSNTLGQTEHFSDSNVDQLSQKLGSALLSKASGIYILTLTWSGKTESYRIIKN